MLGSGKSIRSGPVTGQPDVKPLPPDDTRKVILFYTNTINKKSQYITALNWNTKRHLHNLRKSS